MNVDKLVAQSQNARGWNDMRDVYVSRAVTDGLVLVTKSHTRLLCDWLTRVTGLVIIAIDGDSHDGLDVVYTSVKIQ